ncbi:MAG: helix-turn-helix domain-containing protein [Terriglobia bacterium]|nr:helix-turn-helix domain-containing protein [Terriglobia bacterium]
MAAQYITTGKAARRCSVQPDTVLKWVKKGRLPAIRTPGGHYRIDERDLARFAGIREPEDPGALPVLQTPKRILHCWEYFSEELRAECKSCVVYRVRASMCFQLRLAMHGNGHSKEFCKDICQDCPYCRRVHGVPTNVLVITRNEQLIQRLSQTPNQHLVLRYARSGYDSSAVLAVFRPALAVVDVRLLACHWENGGLIAALTSDERAKGMRVLISVPAEGACPELPDACEAGTIPEPSAPADLLRWANCGEVEVIPEESVHKAPSVVGEETSIPKTLSCNASPARDIPAKKAAGHPRKQ